MALEDEPTKSDDSKVLSVAASPTLTRVIAKLLDREQVGILKYGGTVDQAGLTVKKWLQHTQEELMDGAVYIQKVMDELP